MQMSTEEPVRFKRRFRQALIVFAVVEFIVTAFVVFYVVQK